MAHGFQDYTVSSAFERFVDAIERAVTELLCTSSGSSHRRASRSVSVTHSLPFRNESYALTLLPGWAGEGWDGEGCLGGRKTPSIRSHEVKFQDWFLPGDCIVLEPESYSRRILTHEEYHTVISAVAVALDNLSSAGGLDLDALTVPVYVPRHDARRDACGGLRRVAMHRRFKSNGKHGEDVGDVGDGPRRRVGTDGSSGTNQWNGTNEEGGVRPVEGARLGLRTQWFECDSVHGRVGEASVWIGSLSRRLGLLTGRLQGGDADRVRGAMEEALEAGAGEDVSLTLERRGILCASKRTFHVYRKTCCMGERDVMGGGLGVDGSYGDAGRSRAWDHQMPWAPWVAEDDPVGGVEVDVIENDGIGGGGEEDGMSLPFADAVRRCASCCIFAMDAGHTTDTGSRSFLPLQVEEMPRKFLRCINVETLGDEAIYGFPVRPEMQSGRDGFAARLHACIRWYRLLIDHERSLEQDCGLSGGLRIEDALEDAWWIARADELGVAVEPAVAMEDVNDIIENATASLDLWETRHVSPVDVAALHATTIPESLRGVLQVWKAFMDEASRGGQFREGSDTGEMCVASRSMGRLIVGLFRAALAILGLSTSDIVRRQIAVLRAASEPVLQNLAHPSGSCVDIDSPMQALYGISNVLGCVERTAASAASLHQRLCAYDVKGVQERDVRRLVEGMLSNAMRQCPNAGHLLDQDDIRTLVDADRGDSIGFDGPVSTEHVIEVLGDPDDADNAKMLHHRMYVNRLPNEVRIATAILHE